MSEPRGASGWVDLPTPAKWIAKPTLLLQERDRRQIQLDLQNPRPESWTPFVRRHEEEEEE